MRLPGPAASPRRVRSVHPDVARHGSAGRFPSGRPGQLGTVNETRPPLPVRSDEAGAALGLAIFDRTCSAGCQPRSCSADQGSRTVGVGCALEDNRHRDKPRSRRPWGPHGHRNPASRRKQGAQDGVQNSRSAYVYPIGVTALRLRFDARLHRRSSRDVATAVVRPVEKPAIALSGKGIAGRRRSR